MNKIKSYISYFNSDGKYKDNGCYGADQGGRSYEIWTENDEILLELTGDCGKTLDNEHSERFINLIEKYLE